MPFMALNKGSKRFGVQTFQRASRLAQPLRDVELEYLDMRDWYVNQVGLVAQLEERLNQAKAANDRAAVDEVGARMQAEQGKLRDVRQRVRDIGEKSWAEAFYLACETMLPKEINFQLSMQADQILGRTRHELAKSS